VTVMVEEPVPGFGLAARAGAAATRESPSRQDQRCQTDTQPNCRAALKERNEARLFSSIFRALTAK
jgi:hypothetical protein